MAARDPAPPSFLTKNLTPVQVGDLDAGNQPDQDFHETAAMAHERQRSPYAPNLRALEQAITAPEPPLSATAGAISELRYHDMVEFAQGVITKSGDALKSVQPHELAAALNGWALAALNLATAAAKIDREVGS